MNPYGESKLMVEKILEWYQALTTCATSALRYFNAAGADPEGEIGEDHDPETHLIPLAIEAALGRGRELRSSEPTTRRPTAPRFATTSTSSTRPKRTSGARKSRARHACASRST